MTFWNFICKYLFFRWLFGSHSSHEDKHEASDTTDRCCDDGMDDWCLGFRNRYDNQDYGFSQSHDDFLDEQDDYDMMDDDF